MHAQNIRSLFPFFPLFTHFLPSCLVQLYRLWLDQYLMFTLLWLTAIYCPDMYSVTEFLCFLLLLECTCLKWLWFSVMLMLFVNKYCSVNFISLMRWFSYSSLPFSLCWFPFWCSCYLGLFLGPHPHRPADLFVCFQHCCAVSGQPVYKEQPVSVVLSARGCLSLCLLLELAQQERGVCDGRSCTSLQNGRSEDDMWGTALVGSLSPGSSCCWVPTARERSPWRHS